ncbi:hypothetical protein ES703_93191 [subsurface metagenome]
MESTIFIKDRCASGTLNFFEFSVLSHYLFHATRIGYFDSFFSATFYFLYISRYTILGGFIFTLQADKRNIPAEASGSPCHIKGYIATTHYYHPLALKELRRNFPFSYIVEKI